MANIFGDILAGIDSARSTMQSLVPQNPFEAITAQLPQTMGVPPIQPLPAIAPDTTAPSRQLAAVQPALDPLAGANNPGKSTAAPKPSFNGLPAGDRESYAFNYYTKKGLNPAAAAGIVGNMYQESAFRDDVLSGHRMGDNGASGYAAQWQGPRLRNLRAFAAKRGESNPSFNTQLDFALEEMDPASPYADSIAAQNRNAILNAADPQSAALAFRNYFERPSAPDHASRVKYAQRAMSKHDPNFVPTAYAGSPHDTERERDTSLITPAGQQYAPRLDMSGMDDLVASSAKPNQVGAAPSSGGGGGGGYQQAGGLDGTSGGTYGDNSDELFGIARELMQRNRTAADQRRQMRLAKAKQSVMEAYGILRG